MLIPWLSAILVFTALVHHSCRAQGFLPSSLPLIIKSPYSNSWLPTQSPFPNQWPNTYNLSHILGQSIFIRVDNNATFEVVGQEGTGTSVSDVFITPTRTIMMVQAGPMLVNLTYLTPIEPGDLALQSFPFSYIYLNAQSTDGNSHAVQFYTDISGEWVSGDLGSLIAWNTTQTSSVVYHEVQRSAFQPMQEINGVAEDGTAYYATSSLNVKLTYQTGRDSDVRGLFANNGTLNNTQDQAFRAVSDNFPVFAFSWDAGTLQQPMDSPIVWTLGIVRDPAVIYTTSSGNQTRSSLFFTKFSDVESGIDSFLSDFNNAQSRAASFDQELTAAATAVSPDYADLVALITRIVMAGSEITVSRTISGEFNMSDIMMFMKDTGISRRTNPVEVLYASFPAFLYLNSTWGSYLLEPLLKYQQDFPSGNQWAIPDLGSAFPAATGNVSPPMSRAIEDSSSMLIMAWSQARFSGDGSLLAQYYSTFKSWADYLVTNTLTPTGFVTADGLDGTNMTNLAIKGIIGIRAMSEISKSVGAEDDSSSYLSTATTYTKQWASFADSTGHLESTYGSTASWGLIYNLFPDQLLGFSLIDPSIYTAQDAWYQSEINSAGEFGLPYDSNDASTVKAQWTMFTAATINDTTTRSRLINMIHLKASNNASPGVFPTTYDVNTGNPTSGACSPALGAVFSMLSLSLPVRNVPGSLVVTPSHKNTAAIVGGTIGGVALIALVFLAFWLWRRRQRGKNIYPVPWDHQGDFSGLNQNSPSHQVSTLPPPASTLSPLYHGWQSSSSSEASGNGLYRSASTASARREAPPLPRKGVVYDDRPEHYRSRSAASNALSLRPEDTAVLRSEVENLRREMDQMRAQGVYEPPPQYV